MRTILFDTAPRDEFDTVDHRLEIVGRKAVFIAGPGTEMVGTVEAPTRWSSGYNIIRFPNGTWARADRVVRLIDEEN